MDAFNEHFVIALSADGQSSRWATRTHQPIPPSSPLYVSISSIYPPPLSLFILTRLLFLSIWRLYCSQKNETKRIKRSWKGNALKWGRMGKNERRIVDFSMTTFSMTMWILFFLFCFPRSIIEPSQFSYLILSLDFKSSVLETVYLFIYLSIHPSLEAVKKF